MSPRISIVIPCYRDADQLPMMLERMGRVMDALNGSSELILVDDGSPDCTGERAAELVVGFGHPATVVRLARNFGQHPAVFAGLAHARGEIVVTLDSDFQYPPEEIQMLVDHLSPEWPVVSGARSERKDAYLRRKVTAALTRWLNRRTGADLEDFGSMFRAYDRVVVDRMLAVTERHRFVPAVVAWLGVPIREIPISHQPRGEQGTRYRPGPLLDMLFDLVTGYSVFPLRVITALGLLGALVGFIASVTLIVYRVIVGSGVSGTISAFALLFLLLGVLLSIVALLGEFVGRIYSEVKARPYYLVRSVERNGVGEPEPAELRPS